MMLRRPTLTQLEYLAERITPEERAEVVATGYGGYDARVLARTYHACRGPAHVFMDERGPYFAAGFDLPWPGMATSWAMASERLPQHVLEATRVSRGVIRALLASGVHRIQILCMASRLSARAWYHSLGAREEALLRGYGRGEEDFVVCVIGWGYVQGRR